MAQCEDDSCMVFAKIIFLFLSFQLVTMLGVSMGYHRYLSHKSYKPKKWFEYLIVVLGLPAGTPVQWAGNHRAHHMFTDQPRDPHSPHMKGFWYAHCGWYLGTESKILAMLYACSGFFRLIFDSIWRPRTNQEHIHLAKDIAKDPFYNFLSRPLPYFLVCNLSLIIYSKIFIMFLGPSLGLSILFIFFVYAYNLGDAVDSFGHLFGARLERQRDLSTNNKYLGWLARESPHASQTPPAWRSEW